VGGTGEPLRGFIHKERTMRRITTFARTAGLIVFACATWATVASAQEDCVQAWPPGNAFIVGKEGWVSAGDITQFVGDSNLVLPGNTECDSEDPLWDDCHVDTGFTFRKAIDFEEDGCQFTEGDTCYLCKVRCCFWWEYEPICGTCACACDPHYLCKTLWEVVAFSEDGDTGRGCYELEFVSDCPNEDCEGGTSMCTTVLKWNQEFTRGRILPWESGFGWQCSCFSG